MLPSGKLTWQWKIPIFNREHMFNRFIFHCHASLPEGTSLLLSCDLLLLPVTCISAKWFLRIPRSRSQDLLSRSSPTLFAWLSAWTTYRTRCIPEKWKPHETPVSLCFWAPVKFMEFVAIISGEAYWGVSPLNRGSNTNKMRRGKENTTSTWHLQQQKLITQSKLILI